MNTFLKNRLKVKWSELELSTVTKEVKMPLSDQNPLRTKYMLNKIVIACKIINISSKNIV